MKLSKTPYITWTTIKAVIDEMKQARMERFDEKELKRVFKNSSKLRLVKQIIKGQDVIDICSFVLFDDKSLK